MIDDGKTFVDGVRELVEETAARVAEGVLTRALAAIEDLRARGAAFVTEAEALAPRVRAALAFVESVQKAGALPFIGAAERMDFCTATVRDGRIDHISQHHAGPFQIAYGRGTTDPPLRDGNYTVVVSLYRQGGSE